MGLEHLPLKQPHNGHYYLAQRRFILQPADETKSIRYALLHLCWGLTSSVIGRAASNCDSTMWSFGDREIVE